MMQSAVKKVFETIEKYQMIQPEDVVLAGVSGGADSVCLLLCLLEYREKCPFSLEVIHIEHGLRGEESLADAAFVEALCRQLSVPCHVIPVNVKAQMLKSGTSEEEAARELRYRMFDTICDEKEREGYGRALVAVAHNRGDQAETVLHHLIRGSGLTGLGGMRPVRGRILRPLLTVSREEIENYLYEKEQSWCIDRTNLEDVYTRNRLRHQVLPQLKVLNANAEAHMAEAADRIAAADAYLKKQADDFCAVRMQTGEAGVIFDRSGFADQPDILQEYVLRRLLAEVTGHRLKNYGAVHLEALKKLCAAPNGKMLDLPERVRAEIRHDHLQLCRQSAAKEIQETCAVGERKAGTEETEKKGAENSPAEIEMLPKLEMGDTIQLPFAGGVFQISLTCAETLAAAGEDYRAEKKYTKYLAYDIIKTFLCLRYRRQGDYLTVNKEGGRRKLKNYLIDQKIPADCRDEIPLLADDAQIWWVVGYRISEHVKITEQTKKILRITWVRGE